MLGSVSFACCSADSLEYEVCIYRDHLYRLYPGGKMTEASAEDYKVARTWCKI